MIGRSPRHVQRHRPGPPKWGRPSAHNYVQSSNLIMSYQPLTLGVPREAKCSVSNSLAVWLTPQHTAVDSPVLGLAAIVGLEHEGELHELNASLFKQLQHCLVTLCRAEGYLEVLPVKMGTKDWVIKITVSLVATTKASRPQTWPSRAATG